MRRFPRLALLAVVPLLLAGTACGGGKDGKDGEGKAGRPAADSAAGAAFPVTIQHKYGSTTIKSTPKRVVTVGLTDQDAVLALGTVPVGTTEWLGGYPGAIGPWAKDKAAGAKTPTVLKDTGTGPSPEKIAALRPDLILGLYSGLTKPQYDALSKIAPVVAQPGDLPDYGIPWQQTTRTAGKALGKDAEAEKLVTGTEAKVAAVAREHPEFKGKTGLVATPYDGIFVYGPRDLRSNVLTSLGFTLKPELGSVVGKEFGVNISAERTDLLDNDVTVWIVTDPAKDVAKLHANRAYADQKVVKEGREVFLNETGDYGNAISFVSVLSMPYVLDRLVPQLAAAVDGKADTPVARS